MHMRCFRALNLGATLIEIIIVGAILALVMAVVIFVLGTSSKQSQKVDRGQAAHHEAHRFLTVLRQDLRSTVQFKLRDNTLDLALPNLQKFNSDSLEYNSVTYIWSNNFIERISESPKSTRKYKLQPRDEGAVLLSFKNQGDQTISCSIKVTNIDGSEVVNIQELISMDGLER